MYWYQQFSNILDREYSFVNILERSGCEKSLLNTLAGLQKSFFSNQKIQNI